MSGVYFLRFLKVIFLLSPFEKLHHSLLYLSSFILPSGIKKVKKSRREFTHKYFRKLPTDKSSRKLTTPILNGSVLPCVAGESGKQQWCHGLSDPSPRSGRTNRIRANKLVGSAPNCLWREYDFPLLIVHSLFLCNTRPYWLERYRKRGPRNKGCTVSLHSSIQQTRQMETPYDFKDHVINFWKQIYCEPG